MAVHAFRLEYAIAFDVEFEVDGDSETEARAAAEAVKTEVAILGAVAGAFEQTVAARNPRLVQAEIFHAVLDGASDRQSTPR